MHAITPGTWLSGVAPRVSHDPFMGITADQIAAQFLGESGALVLLAALIGIAAAELLLPAVNGFLETGAAFDYWSAQASPPCTSRMWRYRAALQNPT